MFTSYTGTQNHLLCRDDGRSPQVTERGEGLDAGGAPERPYLIWAAGFREDDPGRTAGVCPGASCGPLGSYFVH